MFAGEIRIATDMGAAAAVPERSATPPREGALLRLGELFEVLAPLKPVLRVAGERVRRKPWVSRTLE